MKSPSTEWSNSQDLRVLLVNALLLECRSARYPAIPTIGALRPIDPVDP